MNKKMLIGVLLIAVLAVGGYYFYQSSSGSGMKGNIFTAPQPTNSVGNSVTVYDDFNVKAPEPVGVRMIAQFNNGVSLALTSFKNVSFEAYNKSNGATLTEYKNCGSSGSYDLNALNTVTVNLTKEGGSCDICGTVKKISDKSKTSAEIWSLYTSVKSAACFNQSPNPCAVQKDTFHALLNAKDSNFANLETLYGTMTSCSVAMNDLNVYNCLKMKDIFADAVDEGDYDSAKIAFGKVGQISGCAFGPSDAAALGAFGTLGSADKCKDLKDQLKAAFAANKDSATIASLLNQIKNLSNCDATADDNAAYTALLGKEKCDAAQLNLKNLLDKMPKDSSVQPPDALASGIAYLSIKAMVPTCTLSSTLASTYNTQVCSMINNSFTKKDTAKDVSGALAVVSTAGKVGCITTTPVVANAFMKTNNTNVCKKLGTDFMTAKAGGNSTKMTSVKADGVTLGCNITSWK
ncbi:MAG: hypothetical protein WCT36_02650 [Candidatus Gracilibacteria bacterium]|jgi:hypothetical protein